MESPSNDPLEGALKGLSWWPDPVPGLWRRALRSSSPSTGRAPSGLERFVFSGWFVVGAPVAAALVMAIVISTGMMGTQSKEAYRAADATALANVTGIQTAESTSMKRVSSISPSATTAEWDVNYHMSVAQSAQSPPSPGARLDPTLGGRHVIRKAALDVQAEDVRGTYLKILALIPNEAAGEYVEQSQLADASGQLTAYVTLRVRGERLNEVLNTLRGLATPLKEQNDATDVTAQVVDTEARLRNERRVEQELLELLEKRKDSPLEDVLKVSQSLAEVRGRIESLVAQQQQLARQVALATIVVTIQAKPKADPPAPGPLDDIGARFSSAWQQGSSFLIDTLAALVRIIIGGLVWWVLLVGALWWGRRWYLRRATATS